MTHMARAIATALVFTCVPMQEAFSQSSSESHALPPATPTLQAPEHVVLISVDGFRPDFYLEAKWPAVMLRRMAGEGAHAAGVRGVHPSVTYPSHTSLVTGAAPARHGIYYNSPFEPAGQTGRWYSESSAIRSPTLWDAVRASGGTSAALWWPVTVGASIDWNVPEIWPLDESDRTASLRAATTPKGFLEELESKAVEPMDDRFRGALLSRNDRMAAMATYTLRVKRPTLLLVHFTTTDSHQHTYGRDHHMVERAVQAVDRGIARIVEAAEEAGILASTTFIVTGDHGFSDIHTQLAPNVWLAKAGLMEARADRGKWRATFHTSGASAFLMLRDPRDTAALRMARAAVDAQPAAVRKLFTGIADVAPVVGALLRLPFSAPDGVLRPGIVQPSQPVATPQPQHPRIPPRTPAHAANYRTFPLVDSLAAYFDARSSAGSLVSAHRGGPGAGFPDNALETFERAVGFGPMLIELDVRRTRDSELVVLHDDDITKATPGTGTVGTHPLADLMQFRLRDANGTLTGAHVPSLREAFAWAEGRAVLRLDVKAGVTADHVVTAIRDARAENRVMVIARNIEEVRRYQQLLPPLLISFWYDPDRNGRLSAAEANELLGMPLDHSRFSVGVGSIADGWDASVLELLRGRGVRGMVSTFGTLDRAAMERDEWQGYCPLIKAGVGMLITDAAAQAARAVRECRTVGKVP